MFLFRNGQNSKQSCFLDKKTGKTKNSNKQIAEFALSQILCTCNNNLAHVPRSVFSFVIFILIFAPHLDFIHHELSRQSRTLQSGRFALIKRGRYSLLWDMIKVEHVAAALMQNEANSCEGEGEGDREIMLLEIYFYYDDAGTLHK